MPKYKVTKPYWYTLSATVEADNEDDALDKFDQVDTHDCDENYEGYLDSYEDTVEEL